MRQFIILGAALFSGLGITPIARSESRQIAAPNVVLIMTDDLGYSDLSCYGSRDIHTPNLDRLARAGVRLTNFYANAPVCTPTRAGFVTGRYQQRYGLEDPLGSSGASLESGLPATGHSLPRLLKNHGYTTALVGKWHLGYRPEFSPAAHGYDHFFGLKSGYVDYYAHTDGSGNPDLWENDKPVKREGYATDLITGESVSFLERSAGRRFFIHVSYNAPHWPYQPPERPSTAPDNARHVLPHDEQPSTRADYAAIVERVDQGVGQILAALDRLGIANNTLVIYTNDNGGEWLSNNRPLFHRKWTVWEGGIRVPTIARWPGRIPAGTVSNQVGITMDLTATILAATQAPVAAEARLEGIDLLPILERRQPDVERTLFWRSGFGARPQRAVRQGNWKLVVDGWHDLLFDLANDEGEREDLAQQHPDVVRRLHSLLTDWETDVDNESGRATRESDSPRRERRDPGTPPPALRNNSVR